MLRVSEYNVKGTNDFIEKLRTVKVPNGCQMVSFCVKALFINVPLKRIHENHEISTLIARSEMRELLLCMKNVHFTFRSVVYIQTDRVVVGSPFGPVSAGIFMVDLKRYLVPLLTAGLSFWKQYVDGTTTFVKIGTVDHILSILNNLYPNIQFTYETKYNIKLAFLDVMLCKDGENIVTAVY